MHREKLVSIYDNSGCIHGVFFYNTYSNNNHRLNAVNLSDLCNGLLLLQMANLTQEQDTQSRG